MDDEQARAMVERANGAVGVLCYASVTPRQLRVMAGGRVLLRLIWTSKIARAQKVC